MFLRAVPVGALDPEADPRSRRLWLMRCAWGCPADCAIPIREKRLEWAKPPALVLGVERCKTLNLL